MGSLNIVNVKRGLLSSYSRKAWWNLAPIKSYWWDPRIGKKPNYICLLLNRRATRLAQAAAPRNGGPSVDAGSFLRAVLRKRRLDC